MTGKLAIFGGVPVIADGPPPWPLPDGEVRAALEAAFRDGSWGSYHGVYCKQLAAMLAEMHQVEHCLLCSSGTIAVELALRGLSVGSGDEVVLAGYDFPGNFRAVEAVGARPVLADISPSRWCLDASRLAGAIGQRTRAVIVSHLHGGMATMSEIRELADRHGVGIVEDACQAPGALVEGKLAGTWGDVGVLSFGGSKLLTSGRGGALVSARADVIQRVKIYAQRGNEAFPLSELQAAVLLPQLRKLAERNTQRRQSAMYIAQHVAQRCRDARGLIPLAENPPGSQPAFYKLAWLCGTEQLAGVSREQFVTAVRAEGVALDAGFRGFTGRSRRRCEHVGPLNHSRQAAEQTVLLHHPVLLQPESTLDQVVEAIIKVLDGITQLKRQCH